jgi:hypothetical protein
MFLIFYSIILNSNKLSSIFLSPTVAHFSSSTTHIPTNIQLFLFLFYLFHRKVVTVKVEREEKGDGFKQCQDIVVTKLYLGNAV